MNGGSLDTEAAKNGSGRFARVALPIPVDRPFTYEVPPAIAQDLFVGRRVEVPFGKRVLSGVVTELIGAAVPAVRDWGDLDLNYRVVAEIDEHLCTGCGQCHIACRDGGHHAIHLPGTPPAALIPISGPTTRRMRATSSRVAPPVEKPVEVFT